MARHVGPRAGVGRRVAVAVSLLLAAAGAVVLGVVLTTPPSPTASGTPEGAGSGAVATTGAGAVATTGAGAVATTDWVDVLARLDRRRSRAFAEGAPAALGRVYVAGSSALRTDRRLLRRYLDRGLRVTGLRMQVADVRRLRAGDGRAVLRVRDRVVAGRVEGERGGHWALRQDTWTRHRITLVRGPDGWRISDLRVLD